MKSYLRARATDLALPALYIRKNGSVLLVAHNPKYSAPPPMPGLSPAAPPSASPFRAVVLVTDLKKQDNAGMFVDLFSLTDLEEFHGSVVLENE